VADRGEPGLTASRTAVLGGSGKRIGEQAAAWSGTAYAGMVIGVTEVDRNPGLARTMGR
jgi:hypothetical protein